MKILLPITLALGLATVALSKEGTGKYLDFSGEALRLFYVAKEGEPLGVHDYKYFWSFNHQPAYMPAALIDTDDKVNGDLSLVFFPKRLKEMRIYKGAERFGFLTSLSKTPFPLGNTGWDLQFHLKVEGSAPAKEWRVKLIDGNGKTATATLEGTDTDGRWKAMAIPLKGFEMPPGFDVEGIEGCEFDAGDLAGYDAIKFDFLRFESADGKVFGITDKTIDQRMAEQVATRQARLDAGVGRVVKRYDALPPDVEPELAKAPDRDTRLRLGKGSFRPIYHVAEDAFVLMLADKHLDLANRLLTEFLVNWRECLTTDRKSLYWTLSQAALTCRFYHFFSEREGSIKGRMFPETEKLLLEVLWEYEKEKNDIHWARQGVWNIDGSENHDLSARSTHLLSSRIFMGEPDYKDRIFPNQGFGGGQYYFHTGYHGKGVDPATRVGGGRANLSDGKPYTAKDHYEEWVRFFKEYFASRVRHGFFQEHHAGYMKYTINYVHNIYAHCGDEDLRKLAENFLTLFYADLAQNTASGRTGAPWRRHGRPRSNVTPAVEARLGGLYMMDSDYYWTGCDDYRLPKVVQLLMLDREGMGRFTHIGRMIGEEKPVIPRPLGTERSFICEPNSRIVKYIHVTPGYSIGSYRIHPLAYLSHTMGQVAQGMTLARTGQTLLLATDSPERPKPYTGAGHWRSAQQKNAAIWQAEDRRDLSPAWFPNPGTINSPPGRGIVVGTDWDEERESDGWVFLRKGGVYAAVLVVADDPGSYDSENKIQNPIGRQTAKDVLYDWDKEEGYIRFKNRNNPVILIGGDAEQYGGFPGFREAVEKAPLTLYKTIPGGGVFQCVFTPPVDGAEEMVFNANNWADVPTIGGEYIDYEHPMTFDSPYLKSEYASGIVKIQYGGEELTLDFTNKP